MALYGPFYAGKDAPVKLQWKAPIKQSVKKTLKTSKKATPAISSKIKCSSAARQLAKCRGTKRNASHANLCKIASKTLYGCRKK